MSGPWEKYPKLEEKKPTEPWTKYKSAPAETVAQEYEIEGELDPKERAVLSFASGEAERRGYLQKEFPGIEFAKSKKGDPIVKLPGEKKWRYEDDPSVTYTDIVDFAGDVPGLVGTAVAAPFMGPFAAGAVGEAGGEIARKAIGRGLLGIPTEQKMGQDVLDVGLMGTAGGIGGKAGVLLSKYAGKVLGKGAGKAAKEGVEEIPEQVAKQVISEAPEQVTKETVEMGGELGARDAIGEATLGAEDEFIKQRAKEMLAPKSLKELEAQAAKGMEKMGESLTSQRMREIESVLTDLEFKPHDFHKYMLENKTKWDIGRAMKDLPSETAESLKIYDHLMKREGQNKIASDIISMAPGARKSAENAGADLVTEVQKSYRSLKDELGPDFQRFREMSLPEGANEQLLEIVSQTSPDLFKAMKVSKKGQLGLKPYDPSMGLSKKEYSELKLITRSLNNKDLGFNELINMRGALRKGIDPKNPIETLELEKMRKALLTYMQENAPDEPIREAMKRYSQNETKREIFEKLLGGKLETKNDLLAIENSKVLDKVFKSPEVVRIIERQVGPEKTRQLAADYLYDIYENAIKSESKELMTGQFTREFQKKLNSMAPVLDPAFVNKMQARLDLLKLTADAPPLNPSQTGKANVLYRALSDPKGFVLSGVGKLEEATRGRAQKAKIDKILQGLETPPVPYRPGSPEGMRAGLMQKTPKSGILGAKGGGLLMGDDRR